MFVPLGRNSLHMYARRCRVLVSVRVLRLDDAPRGLAHPPGKGVTRLATDTFIAVQVGISRKQQLLLPWVDHSSTAVCKATLIAGYQGQTTLQSCRCQQRVYC